MRVSVSQPKLKDALSLVGRALPPKSPLPILSGVLLQVEGSTLTLIGTDLQTVIGTTLHDVGADGDGLTCLSAEQFSGFVKGLPGGMVSLDMDGERAARIEGTSASGRVPVFDPADYPHTFGDIDGVEILLMCGDLADVLNAVFYALPPAADTSRPQLRGVHFTGGDGLEVAAADGFSLAFARLPDVDAPEFAATIAQEGLRDVLAVASGEAKEAPCSLRISENVAVFDFGDTRVQCRLVAEQFADYRRIVPNGRTTLARIMTTSLRTAIDLVAPFCGTETMVTLRLFPGEVVTLRGMASDGASDGRAEVTGAQVEGEPLEISASRTFLREMLASFGDQVVEMWCSSPTAFIRVQTEDGLRVGILVPMYRGAKGAS